jgi:hypothetical protein
MSDPAKRVTTADELAMDARQVSERAARAAAAATGVFAPDVLADTPAGDRCGGLAWAVDRASDGGPGSGAWMWWPLDATVPQPLACIGLHQRDEVQADLDALAARIAAEK